MRPAALVLPPVSTGPLVSGESRSLLAALSPLAVGVALAAVFTLVGALCGQNPDLNKLTRRADQANLSGNGLLPVFVHRNLPALALIQLVKIDPKR